MAAKKKTKKHDCAQQADKTLKLRGVRLTQTINLKEAPQRIWLATERISGKGNVLMVCASYCPFCGIEMPE